MIPEDMQYELQWKNEKVADILLDRQGNISGVDIDSINIDILPYGAVKRGHIDIGSWWHERAVPFSRIGARQMLESDNVASTSILLAKNLGLSLTDLYWIKLFFQAIMSLSKKQHLKILR